MQKILFMFYNLGWQLLLPFLKLNPRLKEGYTERTGVRRPESPADIWIQAASAGEAYLAASLINNLTKQPIKNISARRGILITTNTRQGMEILEQTKAEADSREPHFNLRLAFFPFDQPAIMKKTVRHIDPKVMVLLETELWPGLLAALHRQNRRILIINGRMTEKSLNRYMLLPRLWQNLAPDRVLAISHDDAKRFARLFKPQTVSVMSNIKFDRIKIHPNAIHPPEKAESGLQPNPPDLPVSPDAPFLVLGSIRQEEEADVSLMIEALFRRIPNLVIGLFPRHMYRLSAWERRLANKGRKWEFRSRLSSSPVPPGTLVLWDRFGELNAAYAHANAIFVGGSLAPLGGQNFLEPLMHGVIPVIGPSWKNFAWVGPEIFSKGLVRRVKNWREAAGHLIRQVETPPCRKEIRDAAASYIRSHQGGTDQAGRIILQTLEPVKR